MVNYSFKSVFVGLTGSVVFFINMSILLSEYALPHSLFSYAALNQFYAKHCSQRGQSKLQLPGAMTSSSVKL